jgi:hypothetical protein
MISKDEIHKRLLDIVANLPDNKESRSLGLIISTIGLAITIGKLEELSDLCERQSKDYINQIIN